MQELGWRERDQWWTLSVQWQGVCISSVAPHQRTLSLSKTLTVTGDACRPSNRGSGDVTVGVIVSVLLPSATPLSTAVTATVWLVRQLAAVSVTDGGSNVAHAGLLDANVTVTLVTCRGKGSGKM